MNINILSSINNGTTALAAKGAKWTEHSEFSTLVEFSEVEQLKREIITKYNVNLNPASTDGSFNNLFISEIALQRMVNDADYKKEIMSIVDTFPRFLQETKTCNAIIAPAKGAYMRIRDDGSYVRTADLADEVDDYSKKDALDIFSMLNGNVNNLNNEGNTFYKAAAYDIDYTNILIQFASKKRMEE